MKDSWRSLAVVCVLVVGIYAYAVQIGLLESLSGYAPNEYYNLLVQGFRAGQLNLKKEVPPGFAQLADPYDLTANAAYRDPPYNMLDMSYYKGKLYVYYGVTPALLLFWPFVALTGDYLFHREAVAIFCAIGFLASVCLLWALWRRYFTEVSVAVVVACVLALGLATGVPVLLPQSSIYEVAISCGYMLTMLALAAIWRAMDEQERRCRWLAAASVAYGLAVGARPNLLFGAAILLVPVALAWRGRRQVWAPLMAAIGPIVLIGLALMLYNARRFGSPLEFGWSYLLAGERPRRPFSLHYLWFNFRLYFLEPVRWSSRFPFVREIIVPPMPAGHGHVENTYGVLTNVPLVWLVLAVPLAWRGQSGQAASILRWFVAALALLSGICVLTLGLFFDASARYEMDFLPALVLLAAVGILGLERVLAPTSESGQADRLVWRRAARWGWGLLLGFSVAFNLLVSVENYAKARYWFGIILAQEDRMPEVVRVYEEVLWIKPDYAEAHNNLGIALQRTGKVQEAVGHYEQALRIRPDYAEAHNNLGNALQQTGKVQEAIGHYEQALRIKPDFANAHYNLGAVLEHGGKLKEAIGHYEEALRIKPDFTDARNALARLQARQ